jgi:hypothetical protein
MDNKVQNGGDTGHPTITALRNLDREDQAAQEDRLDARSGEVRQKTARALLMAMVLQVAKIVNDRTVLGPEEVTLYDHWLADLAQYIRSINDREKAIAYVDPAQYVEQQVKQTIVNTSFEGSGPEAA